MDVGRTETKRDNTLDILKGIGMVCVVAGHAAAPMHDFIYLFHMAIFLIASGYLCKDSYANDWKGVFHFILRKFKTLWIPFALSNTIFA